MPAMKRLLRAKGRVGGGTFQSGGSSEEGARGRLRGGSALLLRCWAAGGQCGGTLGAKRRGPRCPTWPPKRTTQL